MPIPLLRLGSRRWTRRLGAGGLAAVAGACTVSLFAVASSPSDTALNLGPHTTDETARGVRTSVVRDNHVVLRASVDEVTVGRPKAFGPFRIGFLRAVSARGVVVEAFDQGRDQSRPFDSAPVVADALTHFLPRSAARRVAKVEVEGFDLTRYQEGEESFAMRARRCETTVLPKGLLCTGGWLRAGGSETRFRRATFADGGWQLDGKRWPSEANSSTERRRSSPVVK
jgi:hypothetical protein